MIPGEFVIKQGEIEINAGRTTVKLRVANTGLFHSKRKRYMIYYIAKSA